MLAAADADAPASTEGNPDREYPTASGISGGQRRIGKEKVRKSAFSEVCLS
jgi:hypothetical protein